MSADNYIGVWFDGAIWRVQSMLSASVEITTRAQLEDLFENPSVGQFASEIAALKAAHRWDGESDHEYGVRVVETPRDPNCTCAEIMANDKTRHFKGCSLREVYRSSDLTREPVRIRISHRRHERIPSLRRRVNSLELRVNLFDEAGIALADRVTKLEAKVSAETKRLDALASAHSDLDTATDEVADAVGKRFELVENQLVARIEQLEKVRWPHGVPHAGPVDPNIFGEVLKHSTPLSKEAATKMLEDEKVPEELSDKALLTRAADFLDGPGYDASGRIDYTAGPNKGKSLPTQEAELLAEHFKGVRDRAWMTKIHREIPFARDRPTIVCLCGSTRFSKEFAGANLAETLAGKIVLTVGSMTHSDDELSHCRNCGKVGQRDNLMKETCLKMGPNEPHRIERSLTPAIKSNLDELHKRKIEMADEVLVLNVIHCAKCHGYRGDAKVRGADGCEHDMKPYIGESTKSEIAHALRLGKPVRFLNRQLIDVEFWKSIQLAEPQGYPKEALPGDTLTYHARRDATPKSCDTCIHKCMDMDMDPYCIAVNPPWGSVLTRLRPVQCAGEDGNEYLLWKKDTRR